MKSSLEDQLKLRVMEPFSNATVVAEVAFGVLLPCAPEVKVETLSLEALYPAVNEVSLKSITVQFVTRFPLGAKEVPQKFSVKLKD